MTVYMVERNLKGIAMNDLAAAQKLAISDFQAVCGEGHAHALHSINLRTRRWSLHVPV